MHPASVSLMSGATPDLPFFHRLDLAGHSACASPLSSLARLARPDSLWGTHLIFWAMESTVACNDGVLPMFSAESNIARLAVGFALRMPRDDLSYSFG